MIQGPPYGGSCVILIVSVTAVSPFSERHTHAQSSPCPCVEQRLYAIRKGL